MAVARDNSGTISGTGTAVTTSIVLGGSNITVLASFENITDGSDAVTSVTVNGNAMTSAVKINVNGSRYTYVYIITAQSSGTVNLTINSSSSKDYIGSWASYKGTSGTLDNTNYVTTGNGTPATFSITPVATNCWAVVAAQNSDGQWTTGTGSNTFINDATSSSGVFDSNGTITAGIAYSMTLTRASLRNYSWAQVTLAPSGGATTNSNFFQFM